jgi:hypothetical protein
MQMSIDQHLENIKLSAFQVFLCGAGVGALSFIVAEFLNPKSGVTPSQHDLALAHRIGFVFPALAGWWAGWLQRSLARMIAGMTIGSGIGFIYASLCGTEFNFLAILMGFPCCCGGLLAMLLGSNRDSWLTGLPARFFKGLVAGLVCGVVYTVLLNIVTAILLPYDFSTHEYVRAMWRAGIPALGIAGGFFFLLLRWALKLNGTGIKVDPQGLTG